MAACSSSACPPANKACSYAITGANLAHQALYVCRTCHSPDSGLCVCGGCRGSCHRGHEVSFLAFGRGFCDCGAERCALSAASAPAAARLRHAGALTLALDADGRVEGTGPACGLDYSSPCRVLRFEPPLPDAALEGARAECEQLARISKQTFWVPAAGGAPRCGLEALAAAVFAAHAGSARFNPARSGAEYWVQVKRVGPTSDCAIDLHYDKDEELAEAFSVGVYPQLSSEYRVLCKSAQSA